MVSEPVTLGGGIAITNGRADDSRGGGLAPSPDCPQLPRRRRPPASAGRDRSSGRNTPRSSQTEYQRASTRAGS